MTCDGRPKVFLPLPDYDLTHSDEVELTIPGSAIDAPIRSCLWCLPTYRSKTSLPLTECRKTNHGKCQDSTPFDKLIKGRGSAMHIKAEKWALSNPRVSVGLPSRASSFVRLRCWSTGFWGSMSEPLLDDSAVGQACVVGLPQSNAAGCHSGGRKYNLFTRPKFIHRSARQNGAQ